MFQILTVFMLGVVSLAFPPLLIVTAPAFILWLFRISDKRKVALRQVDAFVVNHELEQRRKAARKF